MKRTYIDPNVHVKPDGAVELEWMVEQLDKYGYSGCVILNHSDKWFPSPDIDLPEGFRLFWGVEIRAESVGELTKLVGKFRSRVDLLAVHGGNETIDRAALDNKNVELLSHPGRMNHIMMKLAAQKKIAIEFNLFDLIHREGKFRSRSLFKLRENLKLARKYGVQTVLTGGISSIYDLRAPREVIALSKLIGMSDHEAKAALSFTLDEKFKRRRAIEDVTIINQG
ncbi:MAG: ribonuclease P protein component 3 [Candidatus Syntrophoarchaeum sp.]|nr:ribonuclease P protein component 3 [Candidatus Syntrophoarchaeum sp.]